MICLLWRLFLFYVLRCINVLFQTTCSEQVFCWGVVLLLPCLAGGIAVAPEDSTVSLVANKPVDGEVGKTKQLDQNQFMCLLKWQLFRRIGPTHS